MNQGKLEVVKQELTRVNIDILGMSKLRWTRMVNLTHMTIISTIVGRVIFSYSPFLLPLPLSLPASLSAH